MENIIDTILAYIQAQDLYTLISLGVLIALLIIIAIYKISHRPTTRYLSDIQEEDIYEDDVFDNDSNNNSNNDEYQNFPQDNTLHDTPTQTNEGGSRMTWLIIDMVAILTFTLISYILVLKNLWKDDHFLATIGRSIGYNVIFYYALIKPTLFNTKPKK